MSVALALVGNFAVLGFGAVAVLVLAHNLDQSYYRAHQDHTKEIEASSFLASCDVLLLLWKALVEFNPATCPFAMDPSRVLRWQASNAYTSAARSQAYDTTSLPLPASVHVKYAAPAPGPIPWHALAIVVVFAPVPIVQPVRSHIFNTEPTSVEVHHRSTTSAGRSVSLNYLCHRHPGRARPGRLIRVLSRGPSFPASEGGDLGSPVSTRFAQSTNDATRDALMNMQLATRTDARHLLSIFFSLRFDLESCSAFATTM